MEKTDFEKQSTMDPEKGTNTPESTNSIVAEETATGAPDQDILTGFKLYITLFSLVVVGFLITLDSSIVVTVRDPPHSFF